MRAARASAVPSARHASRPPLPARLREIAVPLRLQADDYEILAWYIGQPHVRGAYASVADLLVEQVDKLVSDICDWQRVDAQDRPAPAATRRVRRRHA